MTADQTKLTTPLYAVVGAGDLVVKRIRTTAAAVEADPKVLRSLPDRAQSAALDALDQAATVYGELVKRGETLVTRVRSQQATLDTVAQAHSTAAQAKGTATTARRQAPSGAGATRTTAKRTANKATKATSTRAKATRTSATKTARSAGKAASDAAGKVGD